MSRDVIVLLYLLSGGAFMAIVMGLVTFTTRRALAYSLIGGACIAVTSLTYLSLEGPEEFVEARTALVYLLAGAACMAIVMSPAYFIAALVGWRTSFRNRRLVRSALLALVAVVTLATPFALSHFVWIPAVIRQSEQASKERRAASSRTKEGDAAPVFKIDTDEGLEFALGDQRGKVVLVNLFATWCGPCLQELPHLQELWNEHKHRTDFALIVIGREETDEQVKAFKKKRGFSFPMAADPEGAVFSLFAKELIPRTYIISRDGKVCWSITGFAGEESVAEIKTALRRELSK